MKIKVSSPAEKNIAEAALFYNEINQKRAIAFMEEIEDSFKRILQFPLGHTKLEDNIHRCKCKKFPYGVIYEVKDELINILCVMHFKRNPKYWKTYLNIL